MPIILVGVEKGGTGKTTIATNLAAMRINEGYETILVDADYAQLTASLWSSARNESTTVYEGLWPIPCVSKSGNLAWDVIELAKKYDTVIIDAGGRESMELRFAAVVADKVVIPVPPSQFDTWTLDSMEKILREVKRQRKEEYDPENYRVVMSKVSSNNMVREHEEVAPLIDEYSEMMVRSDCIIHDRVSVRKAQREGLSVTELVGINRDGKAAMEFLSLYNEIFQGI